MLREPATLPEAAPSPLQAQDLPAAPPGDQCRSTAARAKGRSFGALLLVHGGAQQVQQLVHAGQLPGGKLAVHLHAIRPISPVPKPRPTAAHDRFGKPAGNSR